MRSKLSSLSRYIELNTDEELEQFSEELLVEMARHSNDAIRDDEEWLDREFNRIYVTYAYPDVTRMH